MSDIIDTDESPGDMDDSKVQAEFNELLQLQNHPGFVKYTATIQQEFDKCVKSIFSDETTVIDIASFFTREEVISTGKVLRRYLDLVPSRIEELKEELENKKRDRTQQ